jgi:putative phosphoribosyl transferase
MGAVGEGGIRVLDDAVRIDAGVDEPALAVVEQAERRELERRAARYRGDRPPLDLDGRTAIIVDDGMATGSTASVACRVARRSAAAHVVMAVPVSSRQAVAQVREVADEVVCPLVPHPFHAVGAWYDDFTQTTDEEVVRLLARPG